MTKTPTKITLNATLWSADIIDDVDAGLTIFVEDEETGDSVIINIEGYFTRPDGNGGYTVHARSDDFLAEVAASCGVDLDVPTY